MEQKLKCPITIVKNTDIESICRIIEINKDIESFKFEQQPTEYYIFYNNVEPIGYVYCFEHSVNQREYHTGFLKGYRGKIALLCMKYVVADQKSHNPDLILYAIFNQSKQHLRLLLNMLGFKKDQINDEYYYYYK